MVARRTSAVGFRVRSGRAITVLVVGPARAPHVADACVIPLSDPAVPTSRQPYHAVMRAPPADGARLERRLREVVETVTRRSVAELLERYHASDHTPREAGLVVGSDVEPARIANEHIRAHALEGRLFRTALEAALESSRLRCAVVVEGDAYATAARALGRSAGDLRRAVTELGRSIEGPWRADEKTATLAAWMLLRRRRR